MENERREQAAPVTPLLDAILAELPPPSLGMEMQIRLNPVVEARERLSQKMEAGTLTQADIEHELSSLPKMGGIEEGKVNIVRFIQRNLETHDIKKLPVE